MFPKGFTAVFVRELRRIFRTKDLFLICLVAPLVYGGVLSSVYHQKRVEKVDVGVIDNDRSKLSRAFIRSAGATANINLAGRYENADDAFGDMLNGRISGFVYIPTDFSAKIKKGQDAYSLVSINSTNFLLSNPVMQSFADVAGSFSAGILKEQLKKKGMIGGKARSMVQPIILDARPVYNPQLNYSDFFLPGLLLVVIQQIILVGLGYTIAEEREHRRVKKLYLLADQSYLALLFGKTLPYILLNFCLGLLFLLGVLPLYDIPPPVHSAGIIVFVGLFVTATTAFGVMLSSCFKSVVMALIVLMFYSMPTFLFSGFSWPAYAMPLPVRLLSYLFPSTYFLRSFRVMLLGDVPLSGVASDAAALIIFTLVCMAVTYLIFRHIFRLRGTGKGN